MNWRLEWNEIFKNDGCVTALELPLLKCCLTCVIFVYSVERDAQLLANRIALLKQEEMKTRKKIEETRKRASEVMKLKQRNNEKMTEKMEKMQYEQMISE